MSCRWSARPEFLGELQYTIIWVFPTIGVPQNGCFFFLENPIKMDDLGESQKKMVSFE